MLTLTFGSLLVGFVILFFQNQADDRRDERLSESTDRLEKRQERLENLRFARELALGTNAQKPLAKLDLRGAPLSGLNFSCSQPRLPTVASLKRTCADFDRSDLSKSELLDTNFSGAYLGGVKFDDVYALGADFPKAWADDASFRDARLYFANFRGAGLSGADFAGAGLQYAHFEGADLDFANLRGANLSDADGLELNDTTCFDEKTIWPSDFEPPAVSDIDPEAGCDLFEG